MPPETLNDKLERLELRATEVGDEARAIMLSDIRSGWIRGYVEVGNVRIAIAAAQRALYASDTGQG